MKPCVYRSMSQGQVHVFHSAEEAMVWWCDSRIILTGLHWLHSLLPLKSISLLLQVFTFTALCLVPRDKAPTALAECQQWSSVWHKQKQTEITCLRREGGGTSCWRVKGALSPPEASMKDAGTQLDGLLERGSSTRQENVNRKITKTNTIATRGLANYIVYEHTFERKKKRSRGDRSGRGRFTSPKHHHHHRRSNGSHICPDQARRRWAKPPARNRAGLSFCPCPPFGLCWMFKIESSSYLTHPGHSVLFFPPADNGGPLVSVRSRDTQLVHPLRLTFIRVLASARVTAAENLNIEVSSMKCV